MHYLRFLLPLALLALAPAAAQTRHDSNAPFDFAADHADLQDKAGRGILSGNVVVHQAELTMKSGRATIFYTGTVLEGNVEASRVDAAGGVTLTRPDQSASCDYAIYDLKQRTILLLGGVVLKQGNNVTRGDRITLDLDASSARLDAAPGGRVTGRFSVPQRAPAVDPK
ncbi:MAG: LptA/OstA family protein [Sphingomonas sp.]|jgi:lipopolysaccharide export system protein LptA